MTDGLRHKQQKDENFPVASFLFNKQNQDIVSAYYDYARCGMILQMIHLCLPQKSWSA